MIQKGEVALDYLWHMLDAFLMFALGGISVLGAAIWHSKVGSKTYELRHQELTMKVDNLAEAVGLLDKRIERLTERMDRLQG